MATEESVLETGKRHGISRQRAMEFCGVMATTLALPTSCAQTRADALGQSRKPVLEWLAFRGSLGNTESMLRSPHPAIEDIVPETPSFNCGQFIHEVQDHVVHFNYLHALDWADVTPALKADPAKISQLAQPIPECPQSSTTHFKGVQDRVRALVASRQLSLFSSGDWGHPAYQLPPEANLLAVAHLHRGA